MENGAVTKQATRATASARLSGPRQKSGPAGRRPVNRPAARQPEDPDASGGQCPHGSSVKVRGDRLARVRARHDELPAQAPAHEQRQVEKVVGNVFVDSDVDMATSMRIALMAAEPSTIARRSGPWRSGPGRGTRQ